MTNRRTGMTSLKIWTFTLATLLWAILSAAPTVLRAAEVIDSYHVVMDVAKSGQMSVTETIKVTSEGGQIRHGIFRDFPLTFTGADGAIHRVDFSVKSIERDGAPEDYFTETIPNGVRIYIGKADLVLPPGDYTYQITYTTDRQIRFFDDHDELYWNVTGNGWQFPILEASATITFPDGLKATRTDFYTGPAGARGKDATVVQDDDALFFAITKPLKVHEGLTIVASLPKGVIAPPSPVQQIRWFLSDHINAVLGVAGCLVVLLYYAVAWLRVGKDPSGGVIVPRWDAPDGLSPAMVNYVAYHGFSNGGWTALAASVLNLAVKGHVKINAQADSLVIQATDKLSLMNAVPGEAAILSTVNTERQLIINKANGKRVENLGKAFTFQVKHKNEGRYYNFNAGSIFLGVLISIAAFACLAFFGRVPEAVMGILIISGFVTIFFGIFLTVIYATMVKGGGGPRTGIVIMVILGTVLLLIIGVLILAAMGTIQSRDDWYLFFGALAILVANFVAFTIMGAPTPEGARLEAGIEGLRRYLTLAEKDRMNLAGTPTMSPQHFETMLPYAVALGVEKPWSRTFEAWLATAAAAATAASYQPLWYDGDRFDQRHFSNSISSITSSMASSMQSSLPTPPPSSSSGFSSGSSGGSSGGGGGGGGGGGW